MDIFDIVKAAPPPQAINPGNPKISTPSPIPPDSPIDTNDLQESGNPSPEDDLHEKTAVQDESTYQTTGQKPEDICEVTDPDMRLNTPRKSKKIEQAENTSIDLMDSEKSDEDLDEYPTKKRRTSVDTSKPNKTKKSTVTDKVANLTASTPRRKRPTESREDDEATEEDQQLLLISPTKTKAQQKMFSDQRTPNFNRKLRVVLRPLRQPDIDSALKSLANSSFVNVIENIEKSNIRGRGRPRKRKPSPMKQKASPAHTSFHIKVPVQNGTRKRAPNEAARIHTPPPSLAKRAGIAQSTPKPTPKPKNKLRRTSSRGRKADPALVKRYGARFFGCVVKVKRTPLPTKWPDCSPRSIGGVRKGHPKKAVSFSEAVEILGSPGGPSRRATFGSTSSKGTPKPTRLQRVDATGNVLEDITLTSTSLFSSSTGTSTSGRPRERVRRRSCNGSPIGERLKRSNQRLPLSRMARLIIDDSFKLGGDDGDDEYIVPNDLPGTQRAGSPPPKKNKISFTTTISDDEDDMPLLKKQKDAQKKKQKPLKESSNRKSDKVPKEQKSTDKTHTENEKKAENSNEIVKEKLPPTTVETESVDKEVVKPPAEEIKPPAEETKPPAEETKPPAEETKLPAEEIKPPAEEIQSEEREGDAHEAETNEVERDRGEEFENATEKKPDEEASHKAEEQVETQAELKETDNSETKSEDEDLQEENVENVEENAAETTESLNESPEKPTNEDRVEKVEEEVEQAEQAEEFSDLPTAPQLPSTTNDNQDDVLEIQTSLDDVRQLLTPSSRLSTPKPRSRLDSGDSDCSFKSASDHGKQIAGQPIEQTAHEERKPAEDENQQAATTIIDDPIDSAELPAELMTPPVVPSTVNGDPNNGSNASAAYYSPMESMATLDDEVLGQLVEPDFQLNSSRHAISRGTLDEIMTALES